MRTKNSPTRDRLVRPPTLIGVMGLVSVVGIVLSQVIQNPYTVVLPPLALVGTVLATLLVYRFPDVSPRHGVVSPPGLRVPLVTGAMIVAAALLVTFTTAGFQRTMPVHLLQFLLYGIVAASVFLVDGTVVRLGLVAGAGLLHRATIYYASALPLGLDTQFHNRAAAAIAGSGGLDALAFSKYWYAPLYHLLTGVTSGFLGVPVRDAFFLTTTLFVTIAPILGIYAVLSWTWSDRLGVLGAFLYLLSDYALSTSVVAGPTSVGLGLFVLLLPVALRYVHDGGWGPGVGVVLLVGVLVVTHQLTLFIAAVAAMGYLLGLVGWRGTIDRRYLALGGVFAAAILLQGSVTRYSGPAGDAPRFLSLVSEQFLGVLASTPGREAALLPAGVDAVVSGAAALTPVHVVGQGLLLAGGVLGGIHWLTDRTGRARAVGIGLGAMTVTLCAFVFVLPTVGVAFLIPSRWFRFLYVPLVLLATPGLAALVAVLASLPGRRLADRTPVVLAVALLCVLAPYAVAMAWNYPGAVDGPVFDDAPGAQRLATTDAEADLYRTVATYAGGATLRADHVGWQFIDRRFGQPASIYVHEHGATPETATVHDGLLVHRGYAATDHGSYELRYDGGRSRVFGPLPIESAAAQSVVYTNGADRVYYLG